MMSSISSHVRELSACQRSRKCCSKVILVCRRCIYPKVQKSEGVSPQAGRALPPLESRLYNHCKTNGKLGTRLKSPQK
eukprot:179573-Pelagomonas_calceolata.AAC.2